MNDIISLDSVRRGRSRHPSTGPGAEAARAALARAESGSDSESDEPTAEVLALPVEEQLSDEERIERVSDTVVRALGRRQLSKGETHELLVAQGASADEAETLVARYEELGYLNDVALADTLVERMSDRNHKSRGAIARELNARKIPHETVTAALEQLDDDHEFELALEAAVKRVGQLSSYDDTTVERRLMGFLSRRGFGSSVVREATRRAMAGRRSPGGPRFR